MNNQIRGRGAAEQRQESVTVLGLGTMGSAIALRLLGAGMTVRVWNRSPLRARAIAELGALAKLAKIQSANDRPDFSLEWALKDLELMRSSAGSAAPVAGAIADRWQSLVERGLGSLDVSAARHGLGDEPQVGLGAIQPLSVPVTEEELAS